MILWSALAGQRLALLFTVVVGVVVFDDIVLLTEEHNHSCSETDRDQLDYGMWIGHVSLKQHYLPSGHPN